MRELRIAGCVFILFATALSAQVPRIFVSGNGTDTGTCVRPAPCRSFAYAMTQVPSGGEIVALDTAGYGIVTINHSVNIYAAPGAVAAIVSPGGATPPDLITIAINSIDDVSLNNLYFDGSNGGNGIGGSSGGSVHISNSTFANFTAHTGVFMFSTDALFLSLEHDAFLGGDGIGIGSSTAGVFLSVASCRFEHVVNGVVLFGGAQASVHDSTFAGCISDCVNVTAFGGTAEATLERVTIFRSATAVAAGAGGTNTARLAYCTIIDNAVGLSGSGIVGRIDGTSPTNTVEGNSSANTMPGTYSAK